MRLLPKISRDPATSPSSVKAARYSRQSSIGALQEEVGFSAIVSTGSMLDLNWGDLISFFGEDPQTQSILLYMESVGDARAFLSAAREVALTKPIIVIKAGRSEAASHAASSHTGALTGSDEVFDAAFRRCGVLARSEAFRTCSTWPKCSASSLGRAGHDLLF